MAQVILEDEAGYDVSRDQRLGETTVAVERISETLEFEHHQGVCCHVTGDKLGDDALRRRLLGFGEQRIEPKHTDSIIVEQAIDDVRHRISWPGPLAEFGLAGLVDIDDDDALIDSARHRQPDAYVVKVIFDAIDDLETRTRGDVE